MTASPQSDLFAPAPVPKEKRTAPYQRSSETSREAAERIQPRTNAMRENVWQAIASCGDRGATRRELESITGYLTQTLTPRLCELEQSGHIRKAFDLVSGPDGGMSAVPRKRDACGIYLAVRAP